MDPISQGALGAAAALSIWGKDERISPQVVAALGALSAMAPDLDVLIRSSEDSLLAIKFHRHFTHSLAFSPVGATVALLPWLFLKSIRSFWRLAWWISFVGYLTHAPLDCATTYGTQFFWPISSYRVSLSWVSVVDPVFTLPLLAFIALSLRRRTPTWSRVGLSLGIAYIGLGALQKHRVLAWQEQLIEARGHQASRRAVYNTFMNQVTWRSLYESGGQIYVDQIRVPYVGTTCLTPGGRLSPAAPLPQQAGPNVQRGYSLMKWFSSEWIAYTDDRPGLLADVRYSLKPFGTDAFWGVHLDLARDEAEWVNTRAERAIHASMIVDLIFAVPEGSMCGARFPAPLNTRPTTQREK